MLLVSYLLEYNRYFNILGIIFIIALAALISHNRRAINVKLIFTALLMQFICAFAVLKTTIGKFIVGKVAYGVSKIYLFADEGSAFVFGNLVNGDGPWGIIFAFKVLPVIIFFGAFTALLFHFKVVQFLVNGVSFIVRPLLGTSGAETLCAVANAFLGQTEAPLLVRDYLKNMTKSELFVVMTSGMATISGAILVVFAAMGVPAQHLLACSVMSIPTSIMIAKIIIPTEKEKSDTVLEVENMEPSSANMFDAIAKGTSDGLWLSLNVGAMLITFVGLLYMVNTFIAYSCYMFNYIPAYFEAAWRLPELSLRDIFGQVLKVFGYLLGFTGEEAVQAGSLLGTKIVANEFLAYKDLINMGLSERATNIMTYVLCGFSNFSCIGIQIGGIGVLVPERRRWLTELGIYAVIGGTLSNLCSAMVASLLL